MWKKWVAAAAVAGVFGAWRLSQGEGALKEFRALQAEACACTTVECGRVATEKLSALLKKHKSTPGSGSQEAEAREIGEATGKCLVAAGVTAQEILAAVQ